MSHNASTTLDRLPSGARATVLEVDPGRPDLLRRLVSMGVVEGAEIVVSQKGPFGCPINIKLLGFVLALRKAEAARISVHVR